MKLGLFETLTHNSLKTLVRYGLEGEVHPIPTVDYTSELGDFDVIIIANNPWNGHHLINDTDNIILLMGEPVRPIVQPNIALCNFAGAAFFHSFYSTKNLIVDNFHFPCKPRPSAFVKDRACYVRLARVPNPHNFNYDYFMQHHDDILNRLSPNIDIYPDDAPYWDTMAQYPASFCPIRESGYFTRRIFDALSLGQVPYIYNNNPGVKVMLKLAGFIDGVNCRINSRFTAPTLGELSGARTLYRTRYHPSKMLKHLQYYINVIHHVETTHPQTQSLPSIEAN